MKLYAERRMGEMLDDMVRHRLFDPGKKCHTTGHFELTRTQSSAYQRIFEIPGEREAGRGVAAEGFARAAVATSAHLHQWSRRVSMLVTSCPD